MEVSIINKATNNLEYFCPNPIIYLADFYFIETLAPSKKTGKSKKKEHNLKEQICCRVEYINKNEFMLKRFRNHINKLAKAKVVKDNSKLEVQKIILLKKIGYSDIK